MATTTTFPGLVTIDPIQGLIDYVQDIKPYHTKVFETLVEYIYTDYINVSITDVTNWNIPVGEMDNIYTTTLETNGTTTPVPGQSDSAIATGITEMFDFFITAPSPTIITIASSDTTNNIVYFSGNVTSEFFVGNLVVVKTGSTIVGKYQLLSVGYNATTNQTEVTLNALANTTGTSATVYPTDTTYNFAYPILSAVVGPVIVSEPITGTPFSVSTFTVTGNATRAIQPGSIIQAVPALGQSATPTLYHVAFVQFIPSFNADGSRNKAGDTSVIGVELDTIFTDVVISTGYIIPFRITGYDGRYDAPYDGMAGYQIVSG